MVDCLYISLFCFSICMELSMCVLSLLKAINVSIGHNYDDHKSEAETEGEKSGIQLGE